MIAPKKRAIARAVEQTLDIRPQAGPQEVFLSSPADIAIYGGAAYAGKTFALIIEPLRHHTNGAFSAVIFRRETTQITNPGGMWEVSGGIYASFGASANISRLEYRFPAGALVKFAHLEHEKSTQAWDGAQIPLIGFDQLEHFSKRQFFYMLSRNRDPSGTVRSYVRATCNPDPESWLAEFLEWWIDQEQMLPDGTPNSNYGFPIKERAGKIRWFIRLGGDEIYWADSREELMRAHAKPGLAEDHPDQIRPKSITFIPGTIFDNKIGMANDPDYLGNLRAMQLVERKRLLEGNWKFKAAAGLLFRREWCRPLPAAPSNLEAVVRYWDLAATEPAKEGKERDPAWTVGVKLGRYARPDRTKPQRFVILEVRRTQSTPHVVRTGIKNTAIADGTSVRVGVPQDPGQAGKDQVAQMVGMLPGFDVRATIETGDKVTRFNPFSAQCEVGNVDYVLGSVPEAYLVSLENFPDGKVKDDADATSGAFRELSQFSGPINVEAGAAVSDSIVEGVDGGDSPWSMSRG